VEAVESAPRLDPSAGVAFAGRYRIIELLGEGDRKRTYLALDTNLERKVALSLIKPDAALSDPEGTRREVEVLGQTGSHDNIVTLYDSGVFDDTEYLVLEFLPGGTLRDYLNQMSRQNRQVPVGDVMRLGRQMARAVSHIHQRGLIHRDIAPANVWLDERQVAHLGDFDSAIRTGVAQERQAMPPTTEAYASPEEVAGGRVDERSDLYSLGAVLYELTTGRRPERDAVTGVIPPPPIGRGVPKALVAVIRQLLAARADDRPESADEVLTALKSAGASHAREEDFEPWIDSLPFPLASILWAYHSELDSRTKIDYLLKFFEALAQFAATVQLSAYRSDRTFFDNHRAAWFGSDPDNPHTTDFRVASFGVWVNLSRRLAKTARRLLSGDAETAETCYELFAANDPDLVHVLTSKKLFELLLAANDCRNAWAGHGGAAGLSELDRRLGVLEGLLVSSRALIGTAFETWIMLKPGSFTYASGVFSLTCTNLMGTRSAFRKQRLEIGQLLDSGRLYLLNTGSKRALELVPLIRVIAGVKTGEDAVYFYNRRVRSGVRWVSYHFSSEPELILDDPDVDELLSDLHSSDTGAEPPRDITELRTRKRPDRPLGPRSGKLFRQRTSTYAAQDQHPLAAECTAQRV
jgi:serine/threonine protein kinase